MSPFRYFVDRPVFAAVISILIIIVGAISYLALPVSQYPEIAPPTIQVSATYPGASAEVVADTVAAPLEQEINGVEGMLYMLSQSTGDGRVTLTVTFEPGTDLDTAQVLLQNRVAIAEPRLPEEVRRLGVLTEKASPDIMMIAMFYSPDRSRDPLYVSNYVRAQVLDRIARIDGVGRAQLFGERAFSMRVWLNPEKVAARGMTAGDIVAALRANNTQVASGTLGQMPIGDPGAFELNVEVAGRLSTPEQFGEVVVKREPGGRFTRLADVARIELGAQDYSVAGYLGQTPAIPVAVFQRPGSNALGTADSVLAEIDALRSALPQGVDVDIVYNPTEFVRESVSEVYRTLLEAMIFVVIVIIIFLQALRPSLIPIVSIPVSLIGTFAILLTLGYSINILTLFALVLAIGIVVDDAIVVVESVERNMRKGLDAKAAARQTMDEVGGALVAISLVLIAVFVPAAFMTGITGVFFSQFAITIVSSTTISVIVSLTLSPALAGVLLTSHGQTQPKSRFSPSRWFNAGFEKLEVGYGALTRRLIGLMPVMLIAYAVLIALAAFVLMRTPTGFIPDQDRGYFIAVVQLPAGASIGRTEETLLAAKQIALANPSVENTAGFAGLNGATFTFSSNTGAIFVTLKPFADRDRSATEIIEEMQQQLFAINEGLVFLIAPPPVEGVGNAGGWTAYIQDRGGRGLRALEGEVQGFLGALGTIPEAENGLTFFDTATPRVFADIDRARAEILGVAPTQVNEALETYIGSSFVNEFNLLGRTYRVTAQADAPFRDSIDDIGRIKTRSEAGGMVPIGSVATFSDRTGPYRVARYNLYPAAEVQGDTATGFSSGQSLIALETLAGRQLADGFAFEWTGLSYQERNVGGANTLIFALAVIFVFLMLAALYESWLMPLAVVLIVPMCILAALVGVNLRGLDNNILTQVGLVVLIGLASKNAILIVEFARQAEKAGASRIEAAVSAARQRLRPILMTSFAFIFGVIPLVIASGAGAELRQSLGTAVFAGMLGVTLFGLLFTPVFYVLCRSIGERLTPKPAGELAE